MRHVWGAPFADTVDALVEHFEGQDLAQRQAEGVCGARGGVGKFPTKVCIDPCLGMTRTQGEPVPSIHTTLRPDP
eukprot:40847-Chlamydomonas_euryale.AAC.3